MEVGIGTALKYTPLLIVIVCMYYILSFYHLAVLGKFVNNNIVIKLLSVVLTP